MTTTITDKDPADLTYVEITLPDGTAAYWWVDLDDAATDALTNAVEALIGSAHQIIC